MGISAVGNGLWLAAGVLFLNRSAGLPAVQVGLGLTLAGLAGVFAGIPLGVWADAIGPRRVAITMLLLEGAATAAYALVHSFALFLVVAMAAAIGLAGGNAARGALLAGLFDTAGATKARATMRSVTNLGISLGTLAAGVVLGIDSRAGYLVMLAADALSFVVAAALCALLPETEPHPTHARGPRWRAARDARYIVLAALNGVMTINYAVLTVALPLWVVTATNAPPWVVAPLFAINTVLCVLLQMRVSSGLDEPGKAATAMRWAGVWFACATILFALAAYRGPITAAILLAAAVVIHTFGELLQAGSSFGLSFALAAPHAHGEYQGVWHVGVGLGESIAPLLLTTTVIGGGLLGWLGLGLLFALTGLATPRLTAWALADRGASPRPGQGFAARE
ncbi:MFS transporter [Labedaea rhizosphaerae]|uniref:MFS transporter n=1 Tax=Labedaea rhizosphaerae TaxID=598644 RepID=A0A4V3CZ63_LABRH|nr:MFS transporter [Labedaea rhizosphaerae]TDP96798.1 MFS transporter [Labedaea rhizosphaerae]